MNNIQLLKKRNKEFIEMGLPQLEAKGVALICLVGITRDNKVVSFSSTGVRAEHVAECLEIVAKELRTLK